MDRGESDAESECIQELSRSDDEFAEDELSVGEHHHLPAARAHSGASSLQGSTGNDLCRDVDSSDADDRSRFLCHRGPCLRGGQGGRNLSLPPNRRNRQHVQKCANRSQQSLPDQKRYYVKTSCTWTDSWIFKIFWKLVKIVLDDIWMLNRSRETFSNGPSPELEMFENMENIKKIRTQRMFLFLLQKIFFFLALFSLIVIILIVWWSGNISRVPGSNISILEKKFTYLITFFKSKNRYNFWRLLVRWNMFRIATVQIFWNHNCPNI